jgi:hypothetical protein
MTQVRIATLALTMVGLAACNGGGNSGAASSSLGQACTIDGDCGKVEQCTHNTCVPRVNLDAGTIDQCKDNSGCATGQVCEHGVCLPHQLGDGGVTLCFDDADCSSGDHCLIGVCLPASVPAPPPLPPMTGVGTPCTPSADCTQPLNCAFHVCLPIDTCTTAATCKAGQQCLKNICI